MPDNDDNDDDDDDSNVGPGWRVRQSSGRRVRVSRRRLASGRQWTDCDWDWVEEMTSADSAAVTGGQLLHHSDSSSLAPMTRHSYHPAAARWLALRTMTSLHVRNITWVIVVVVVVVGVGISTTSALSAGRQSPCRPVFKKNVRLVGRLRSGPRLVADRANVVEVYNIRVILYLSLIVIWHQYNNIWAQEFKK